MIKRARTRNLALILNIAARLLEKNKQLVIAYSTQTKEYLLTPQEVVAIKQAYGIWMLAYIKGFTNEKPSYKLFAERSGLTEGLVKRAVQGKPHIAHVFTYDLLKQWGYIYEY